MGNNVQLSHIVVLEKDNQIFAAGRDQLSRRIKLFLIKESEAKVFSRIGKDWNEIFGGDRSEVIDTVYNAKFQKSVPVYKITGSFNA